MEPLTIFEAAHILGLAPDRARELLRAHNMAGPRSNRVRATVTQVEDLARHHYPWKQHTNDPDSYWVTVGQAAEILAVSIQRVKQLIDSDRLPYETSSAGVRLMRRRQLGTVANARLSRRLEC